MSVCVCALCYTVVEQAAAAGFRVDNSCSGSFSVLNDVYECMNRQKIRNTENISRDVWQ